MTSLLSEKTIRAVRDVSITEVVGHFVNINNKGFACCPFHKEKSPSMKVSDKKNIYKCFGCGAGGDAISFVQKHERLNFIEACEKIASIAGIPVEFEKIVDAESWEAAKKQRLSLMDLIVKVSDIYRNNLWSLPEDHPVKQYLAERKLTSEEIAEWQLGWSPEEWKYLTSRLINDGQFEPAEKLGIVKRSKDGESLFDGYRSRITIPITNHLGQYIGFGGRLFLIDPSDKDKNLPKYINPSENELYSKSNVLYGLSQAIHAIEVKKSAILVEGYFDVISLHKNGDDNTVGTCGTALTSDQAKLLKRYTSNVLIIRDGDKAGMAAAVKDLPILLKQGFKVEIGVLPDGEDPDSFVQKFKEPTEIRSNLDVQDAVMWRVVKIMTDAMGDIHLEAEAKQLILRLLADIPNELVRTNYMEVISKKYKWKKDLQKQLEKIVLESLEEEEAEPEFEDLNKLPKWMDKNEFLEKGYCAVKTKKQFGYYSYGASGYVQITNFLIQPLFHVFAGKDSRHLIQIDNSKKQAVMDVESKAMVSIDIMQQYVVAHGAFIFYGNKNHLLKIATDLLSQFPLCYEIKYLGWQEGGFFAWVNKAYITGLNEVQEYDNWGILKQADKNFLIPAACEAYRELQETGDDPYEVDRVLEYVQPKFNFAHWSLLMQKVYQDKGVVAIAYVFLTAFRDIIFEIDNNCPHLYGFGERTAGKSKWAESVGAVFFHNRAAFNLNSGTDFAFFDYMSRFRNTPALLNEFDEKVIKEEWFQAIKGIFDGESRQRGKIGGNRRTTETMHVKSTLVLTGQYLCTMDDNSIVSRSIIEAFSERDYTEQGKKYYEELKTAESEGLTGLITEVLKYRVEFKAQYKELFNNNLSQWRKEIDTNEVNFNQRIMQNWCHLYSSYQIMAKYLNLPVELSTFYNYCKDKAIHWSNFIRQSDTLSDFWNTLPFLLDKGEIEAGWDFKIEELLRVRLKKGKEDYTHEFSKPTKVLFIRLNNVHKHYEQAYRSRTGKTAMTLDNLLHYFSNRKYYVGASSQSKFSRYITKTVEVPSKNALTPTMEPQTRRFPEKLNTSSFVFLYDALNIDLDRVDESIEKDESLPF